MGGRASKQKGYRGEILVRDHLRTLGWVAERVPGSGAYSNEGRQEYSGDVKASKDGVTALFEVKCRASSFLSVYQLRKVLMGWALDGAQGFVLDGQVVLIGLTPEDVQEGFAVPVSELLARNPWALRTAKKVLNMKKLLNGAHYLVIKDDRMPFLYLRYA